MILVECNGDVGESGGGRFVLCLAGALSPREVEKLSSVTIGFSIGCLRRLPVSNSPSGLADRSGTIRLGPCKAILSLVDGGLLGKSSGLSSWRSCLRSIESSVNLSVLAGWLMIVTSVEPDR